MQVQCPCCKGTGKDNGEECWLCRGRGHIDNKDKRFLSLLLTAEFLNKLLKILTETKEDTNHE